MPFAEKMSGSALYPVEMGDGYQIHNFGKRSQNTGLSLWQVCYCPGYDADHGKYSQPKDDVQVCLVDAKEDFAQSIGTIVLITGRTRSGLREVSVYPTLRFEIEFECGDDPSKGGCAMDDGARYRIVRDAPAFNDKNYYEQDAGCRTYPQVQEQLAPANCISPADCVDKRDESPITRLTPTFKDIQMDATFTNKVMMPIAYDVCYCDRQCFSNANWFKVFDFMVFPFDVVFSYAVDTTDPALVKYTPAPGGGSEKATSRENTQVWSPRGPATRSRPATTQFCFSLQTWSQ
jgi:hypothetical protein